MLYWELDFLNELLNKYTARRAGNTFTASEKSKMVKEIRERLPLLHEDIKYYKDCIAAEKKEMQRIYNTYGFKPASRRINTEDDTDDMHYEEYYDAHYEENSEENSEDDDE
jgi:hypothetical protein